MATRAKTAKTAKTKKAATKKAVKAGKSAKSARKRANAAPTTKKTTTKTSSVSHPKRSAAKAATARPAKKTPADRAPKTRPETTSVAGFIRALADPQQRADSQVLVQMMRAATGCEPVMWGSSIVGFDRYRYRGASGREGDWMLVGFSPRTQNLVLYLMPGFAGHDVLLARLGRHSTGKSCLYVKRLADVDGAVLGQLIAGSVEEMRRRHPA